MLFDFDFDFDFDFGWNIFVCLLSVCVICSLALSPHQPRTVPD
jgi:hypothetical protein